METEEEREGRGEEGEETRTTREENEKEGCWMTEGRGGEDEKEQGASVSKTNSDLEWERARE